MKVGQTSAILCSIFWASMTETHWRLSFTVLRPLFSCPRLWIFFTIYWLCRHALSKQNYNFHYKSFSLILIPNLVWYCDKVEWDAESIRSKLSLFFTLPSPLGNKRLNFLSVQLPPAWMKGSDKTDQDFKVGISNEDRRVTTDSGQSGSSPVGTGRLDYFFCYFFYCKCMDNGGKL